MIYEEIGTPLLWAALGAISLIAVTSALLAFYILHKVRNIHILLFKLSDEVQRIAGKHLIDLSQNLQALDLLSHELQLTKPLPQTRGWAASPDVLLLLTRHARANRPKTIVECGSGVSTLVLARCCQLNGEGHVYSLDHDSEFAGKTRDMLTEYDLAGWATVLDAPLRDHDLGGQICRWYSHEVLPTDLQIELLFIDGPPAPLGTMIRYPAGPCLFPRLTENSRVFLDDAARESERLVIERWRNELLGLAVQNISSEKGTALISIKKTQI